jgi:hypothetical protein
MRKNEKQINIDGNGNGNGDGDGDGDGDSGCDYNGHCDGDYNGDGVDVTKSFQLRLIPSEQVITKKTQTRPRIHKVSLTDAEDLKRFALAIINSRIEFCQKYKIGEENIGKCVCESTRRYIRLSRESSSRAISNKQIHAIKKMFEEMKKEGKIKCQETL